MSKFSACINNLYSRLGLVHTLLIITLGEWWVMMRIRFKIFTIKGLIAVLLFGGVGLKANPDMPSELPNSATWINQLFKAGSSLTDVTNPLNWVVYSAAGTYFYYHYMLKGSLKTAIAARELMLMQLRDTGLAIEKKQKLLEEVDLLIEDLKKQIAASEKAFEQIPRHFSKLNKHQGKKNAAAFTSVSDYTAVGQWLESEKGKKFLRTKAGKSWKNDYDSLMYQSSVALEEPLRKVIEKVNEILENQKAEQLKPSTEPNHAPGTFYTDNTLNYARTQVPLTDLRTHVDNLKKKCTETLSALVTKKATLARDSNLIRFWSRKENISPAWKHGIVALGGVSATYWLHRLYKFDERKKEAEVEAKLKGDGAFDLATTLRLPQARELMQPYYEAIRSALIEEQDLIIEDLVQNTKEQERSGANIRKLIEERLKHSTFNVAIESATLTVAKSKLGDRTSVTDLTGLVQKIKTNNDLRDGSFRAFHKEVIKECIDSLWSELSSGSVTDRLRPETFLRIRQISENLFIGSPTSKEKLQAGVKLSPIK